MNPIEKAVWFVESHFGGELALADTAQAAGVSRFHMTRAFSATTGRSVMQYVRSRRLTEAAKALSNGARDILSVALNSGYNSHEAFTRAFRDEFGVTPEALRAQGDCQSIPLVEPIRIQDELRIELELPHIVNGERLLIAGLGERYSCQSSAGIPSQWQRFLPHFGNIASQIGRTAYGVCCDSDDAGNFDYVCGVEVEHFSGIPSEWRCLRIPEQTYAVFLQGDHVSTIRSMWNTIWNHWLPNSIYEAVDAPDFERYGEHFNSTTGTGGFEIWVPIRAGHGRKLERRS
jgi:AraC family transcriptional regulator